MEAYKVRAEICFGVLRFIGNFRERVNECVRACVTAVIVIVCREEMESQSSEWIS